MNEAHPKIGAPPRFVAARPASRVAALLALLLASLLVAACAKKQDDDRGPATREPVPAAEAQRGKEACEAYVEQICQCAEARSGQENHSELAEACHMAPAKLSSLAAVLEVNRTTSDPKERITTERTARRIMKSCIDSQSKLLAKGCRPQNVVPKGG